jgi:hypothetical protein
VHANGGENIRTLDGHGLTAEAKCTRALRACQLGTSVHSHVQSCVGADVRKYRRRLAPWAHLRDAEQRASEVGDSPHGQST